MKRPAIFVLAFIIFGILLGRYASFGAIVFFMTIIIILGVLLYKFYKMDFVILLPLFSVIGIMLINNSLKTDTVVEKMIGNNVEVYGIVQERIDNTYSKLYIDVKYFRINDKNIKSNSKIIAILKTKQNIKIGSFIIAEGTLLELEEGKNFGGYDERLYLKTKNIDAKMFCNNFKVGETRNNFNYRIKNFRNVIEDIYDKNLSQENSGILKAMLLGIKTDLEEDTKSLYQDAGIYHIIAISGLHISILVGILLFITRFINKGYSSIFIIILLWTYCIFTGCAVSTVRAVIMMTIILFGYIIRRPPDFLNSITLAGLILLLYQPLYLFNVGFQYSFSAVISIAVIYPEIKKMSKGYIKNKFIIIVVDLLAVSISIAFSTKIITLSYFHNLSITDIFINILILPTVSVLLVSGIVLSFSGLFFVKVAPVAAAFCSFVLKIYSAICNVAVSIFNTNITVGNISIFFIIFYYIILILFIVVIKTKNKNFNSKLKKCLIYSVILFTVSSFIYSIFPKPLEIQMLYVGQGDCIVIKNNSKCFVIDGGGNKNKEFGKDTGVNVLMPNLKYNGIKKIDYIFVTHMDEDHVKGIIEIIGRIKIDNIVISSHKDKNMYYRMLVDGALKNNIKITEIKKGDKLVIDNNMTFDCIYPYSDINVSDNNSSIVVKMLYKNISVLFTGDIEKAAEKDILNHNEDIKADILKLAHHGAKTSTSDDFLEAVSPKVCIASAGVNNSYNHPSKETVDKIQKKNIELFTTNKYGDIIIKTDGKKFKVKTKLAGD